MRKRLHNLLFITLLSGPSLVLAQVGIGQWRDHLPYKQTIAIAEGPTKVFVASESAIYEHGKDDGLVLRISKVNGLSDIGVSTLGLNSYNNILVVGYKNGNLDVMDKDAFYNVSDIKRSTIGGNKKINSIYFNAQYAYIACGFGIIYFDTEKKEIKDTYYIGYNGGRINVRDVNIYNNNIYAASDSGLYMASVNAPNLADFNSWSRVTSLPLAIYNTLCKFNGNLYANLSVNLSNPLLNTQDTIYSYDGTTWSYFPPGHTGFMVHKISAANGKMAVAYSGTFKLFNTSLTVTEQIGPFQTGYFIDPRAVIVGTGSDIWVADHLFGMMKFGCQGWCHSRIVPDGPETANAYVIDIREGKVWVAPGQRSDLWVGQYNNDGVFYNKDEIWGYYNSSNTTLLNPVRDVVSVTINPTNTDQVYAGTIGSGILEFNASGLAAIWDETNSSLQVRGDAPTSGSVIVFGSRYDKDGNLWVSNSLAPNPLSVRKADGSWQAFNFGSLGLVYVGNITVTQNSSSAQKWMVLPRGNGILVFNENGTWTTTDDSYRKLGFAAGQGAIPGGEVYCIAEDQDGEIWVGSDKGVSVFYSPDNIFSTNASDAQQILLEQDGHTQILLETEEVTAIAVDGANRKWIGTLGAGVFLMSADGTQEILHFDETNSPLLSNNITSISINGESGEVYFGTASGIISYRSTATEGLDEFTDVYAYPNPVRPGYSGPIAIKGLVKDCDVKITDITGTLIYQTKALGGQAVWNGTNFNGDRAHSGVYLVFCSNDDGSKTYVTKICLVN